MDGEVLNQRMRKFVKPHAGMAQRAIAPVVREAAGNRLEGALRLRPEQPCRCRLALPIDRDIPIA